MKKPFKIIATSALASTLATLPGVGLALGLDDIQVQSKLNEPLRAEIRLLYSDADEVETTEVVLATPEDFQRVGLDPASVPFGLEFRVQRDDDGEFVITVTSNQPVTEPFLDFLVEVNWSNGRLLREYVVLLDPPVVAPAAGPAVTGLPDSSTPDPTPAPSEPEPDRPVVRETPVDTTPAPSDEDYTSYSGDEYGPVASGDTLWEIARDYRPSGDVSINQMMVMLYNMNPDAFYQDNINALKRGAILRMPSSEDFASLSRAEATADVRSQNQLWEDYRFTSARRTPTVSDAGVSPGYDSGFTPPEEDDSRLEIVSPADDTASSLDRPGDGTEVFETDLANVRSDLQRTREDLLSATQENTELQDRVTSLEDLVNNLERAITLKDADIADLQAELEMARIGVDQLASDVADAQAMESTMDSFADDESTADDPLDMGFGVDERDMDDSDDALAMDDGSMDAADPTADTGFDSGFGDDPSESSPMDDATDDMAMDDEPAAGTIPDTGDTSASMPPAVTTPQSKESGGIMSILLNPFVLGGILVVFAGIGALVWRQRRSSSAGESLIDAMMDDEDEYTAPEPPPPSADMDFDEGDEVAATAVAPMISEDSLIDAVQTNPDDPQAHLALLRMYYTENERDKFVTAAERMNEQFGGSSHPAWAEVRGMGANLAGDHPLFGGQGGAEPDAGDDDAGLDLQGASVADEAGDEDLDLDLDLGGDEDASEEAGLDLALEESDDELGLDLDLDDAAPAEDVDETPAADADGELDLDLDLDLDQPEDAAEEADTADELEALDFDLEAAGDAPAEEAPVAEEENTEFELEAITDDDIAEAKGEAPAADDDDLGIGDLDLDLDLDDDEGEPAADAGSVADAADDEPSAEGLDDLDLDDLDLDTDSLTGDDDAVGTKLDLARAYIDMGDPDGARGMLEEVVAEGSDEQKEEAQKLLSDLG